MSHPLEVRIQNLKELLKAEGEINTLYAQDLKLSIARFENDLKTVSPNGYKMVNGVE